MGQTNLFLKNAIKLGVDLAKVDIAILSHGHYDHGSGLEEFLRINDQASVYVSQYAFEAFYNGKEKYIGLNSLLKQMARLSYQSSVSITLFYIF